MHFLEGPKSVISRHFEVRIYRDSAWCGYRVEFESPEVVDFGCGGHYRLDVLYLATSLSAWGALCEPSVPILVKDDTVIAGYRHISYVDFRPENMPILWFLICVTKSTSKIIATFLVIMLIICAVYSISVLLLWGASPS